MFHSFLAYGVQSGCHSGEGRNLSAKGGSALGGKISKQDASLRWHDTHPERLPGIGVELP
ncbi:MAG: hypothetical protein HY586_03055 [Candidatus Omnitrophica bacterium]|nr:hypothetical protein [Candidatus Omnitrophota bacterium]